MRAASFICSTFLIRKCIAFGVRCSPVNLSNSKGTLRSVRTSMDASSGFNVLAARDEHALELAQFAGESFALTFGHLYPPEDTAMFIKTDYTEEIFLNWIQDKKYGIWIATAPQDNSATGEAKDAIVGYIVCAAASLPRTESSSGEVKKLYVSKDFFGKGLANILFETGIAWLRTAYSGHPIYISVYSENFRAIKFYNRYKFEFHDEYLYEVGANRDREFILRETDPSAGLPLIK